MVGLPGCGPSVPGGTSPGVSPSQSAPDATAPAAAAESDGALRSNQVRITKDEYGDDWPFTVSEGVLEGAGSGGLGEVLFTADGVTYAVNGTAKQTGKYVDIEKIWADDPALEGLKKNIGPIVDRGLGLCK